MDLNSSEKRFKTESIDRISALPDKTLGKILSYLPIKEVIATSILSTRWKPLFPTHVPLTELVLDDSHKSRDPEKNSSSCNFVDFVDTLLNVTLRDVPLVEKVIFNCENEYGDNKIVSWVCAAVRLNVQSLRVMSEMNDSEALFETLNGCTTLVELELGTLNDNEFQLYLPEEFVLPNLKRLTLWSLLLRDDSYSIHELIDGCPVLDDLKIIGCDLAVMRTLYIQHPVLNKLSIDGSYNESGCTVRINAPNLEAFEYEGHFVANYVVKKTGPLHSVCICFDSLSDGTYEDGFGSEEGFGSEDGFGSEEGFGSKEGLDSGVGFGSKALRLAKLYKAGSKTTRLCLLGNAVQALHRSSVSLPKFKNLTCLAIGCMGSCGWGMLAKFLKSAPKLTTLTFEEGLASDGDFGDFQSLLPSLPVCLKLHVKKIEIWEFKWRPDEIKLVEYFLKNGKVLQELIVHCLPHENTSNLEKLSMLPKHSNACQVLLKDNDNWGKSRYSRDMWFLNRA